MKLFKENYDTDSRIDFSKGIKQFQGNTIENPTGPTLRPSGDIEKTKSSLKDSRPDIIKPNKYFKTSVATCIDLILANKLKSFQNAVVMKTGVSDHHRLIFSFLKNFFRKIPSNNYVVVSTSRLIK